MADTTVDATDNVIFHVNQDGTTDEGEFFRVKKQTSETAVFTVAEDGDVTLTGDIRRGSLVAMDVTRTGDGDVVYFKKGGTKRLTIAKNQGQAQLITGAGTDDDLVLYSTHDVVMVLDHDDDTATSHFKVKNQGLTSLFDAGDDRKTRWYDTSGNTQIELDIGTTDVDFEIGKHAGTRGVLALMRDNTSGSERAGVLALDREDIAGIPRYLWVDTDGKLRIHTADPGTSDTGVGTVVGTQS